jgi:hypothetical protein
MAAAVGPRFMALVQELIDQLIEDDWQEVNKDAASTVEVHYSTDDFLLSNLFKLSTPSSQSFVLSDPCSPWFCPEHTLQSEIDFHDKMSSVLTS